MDAVSVWLFKRSDIAYVANQEGITLKPSRQDVLLSIIAIALCAIAVKIIFFESPTYGDFRSLAQIQNSDARQEKLKSLVSRTPVVWVRGGSIDADVSGSVSID